MTRPKGVYGIVQDAREHAYDVPLGVTLGPCAFCPDLIERTEDATVYQQTRNGPALMAHKGCAAHQLTRIVRAMGRSGSRNLTVALRLDR